MASQNGNTPLNWTEWFRLVTPFFLFILTILASTMTNKLSDIDNKLFKHLTNDEIHTPRSVVTTKAEFDIYQQFRDKQMTALADIQQQQLRDTKEGFAKLSNLIERHMELTGSKYK